MKRNMDLVREILLRVEAAEGGTVALNDLPAEHDEADIGRHTELMICRSQDLIEHDLLEETVVPSGSGLEHRVLAFDIRRMTWEEHDFLDAARNETIWIRAQRLCREMTGGLAFDLLKMCLLETAREAIAA